MMIISFGKKVKMYTQVGMTIFILLTGCAGDSGETVEVIPDAVSGSGGSSGGGSSSGSALTSFALSYNGPEPTSQSVRDFKSFFWSQLTEEVYQCTACHMQNGSGEGSFVRNDDINLAYSEALPLVDLATPENSQIADKVFNGHNCWVQDTTLCRDTIIGFIRNWANGVAATSATQVIFSPPDVQLPTGAVIFPDVSVFSSTVYPLLTSHCAGCHSDSAPTQLQQAPLFAHTNIATAYEAAKTKIDVSNAEDSRLVVRLRDEVHNCWSDCTSNANEMLAQINALLPDSIDPVDPNLVTSLALRMEQDGIIANSGGRIDTHVIAKYEFRLGQGNIVDDRSNVAPLAPLTLSGDYEWQANWGIKFNNGRAQATVETSRKLFNEIRNTEEYTIEAWIFPDNVTQDDSARIVSYAGSDTAINFALGQSMYNYDALVRSSTTGQDARPLLSTADADEDAQTELQHVVVTYHPERGREIFVNGVNTGDTDNQGPGNFYDWDNNFALVLGNEITGNHAWQGTIRFLAIHRRALSPADIQNNFDVGVGQKFFLLFGLHSLEPTLDLNTETPVNYIGFTVSQYDNYSYLFTDPFYMAVGESTVPVPFTLQGMRIGINGKVLPVGQTYTQINQYIEDTGSYDSATGIALSLLGQIIPLENGPSGATADQFFLSFEQLGSDSNPFVEPVFAAPDFTAANVDSSDLGVRTFSEITETFAQITGVASDTTSVRNTYDTVIQQLPPTEDIQGFLSSHQMGVTQLAITYCSELIDSPFARANLNITLDEDGSQNIIDEHTKTVADWDTEFIDPMLAAVLNADIVTVPNVELNSQPLVSDVKPLIHHLLFTDADGIAEIDASTNPTPNGLARCLVDCNGNVAIAAKAACSAILASAVTVIQ